MTTLDGTAIQEVERLVKEAETVIVPNAEQRGVYFLREADGSYTHNRARHDPKDVTLYDLESLAREIKGKEHLQTVYVSDSEVIALFDDSYVRWQAKVALPRHPAYMLATRFVSGFQLTQKDLVRLLRTELSAAVPISTIDTFANLRFQNNSDTTTRTQPMSSGLDRHIQQKVMDKEGVNAPETLDLQVPVFDIPEARSDTYPVRVFMDYDHDKSAFLLVTRQDDLRVAQETAVRKVINQLESDERVTATVAYGSPK